MATGSIPDVGSRVSVQLFAGDLLAHQGLVSVESYQSSGYVSVLLSDGAGAKIAVTGDRSSVRMVLSAALAQLADDDATTEASRRPDIYLDGIDHDTGHGGARLHAAAELQARGELEDGVADALVGEYNTAVHAADQAMARLDPGAFPPEVREIVEGFREARETLERPSDPVEVAVDRFNDFVRSVKPPTVQEQLAALGLDAEPEPEPEPVSQEA